MKLLVLAPHPDDAELGCGGTIAKAVQDGHSVVISVMCDRGEREWYREEIEAAATELGPISDSWDDGIYVVPHDYTVFCLQNERSAILRRLERYRDELQPHAVFVPGRNDQHQDHQCVHAEAKRAFRGISLYGYEIVCSNTRFRPTLFMPLEPEHIERKVAAVSKYKSQVDKLYMQPGAIEGLARVRGAQFNVPLAEAFEVEWEAWQ